LDLKKQKPPKGQKPEEPEARSQKPEVPHEEKVEPIIFWKKRKKVFVWQCNIPADVT
jgi:hypothetical protein